MEPPSDCQFDAAQGVNEWRWLVTCRQITVWQAHHAHPLAHGCRHREVLTKGHEMSFPVRLSLLAVDGNDRVIGLGFDRAFGNALENTKQYRLLVDPTVRFEPEYVSLDSIRGRRNGNLGPHNDVATRGLACFVAVEIPP